LFSFFFYAFDSANIDWFLRQYSRRELKVFFRGQSSPASEEAPGSKQQVTLHFILRHFSIYFSPNNHCSALFFLFSVLIVSSCNYLEHLIVYNKAKSSGNYWKQGKQIKLYKLLKHNIFLNYCRFNKIEKRAEYN